MFNYRNIKFGSSLDGFDIMVSGRRWEVYRADIIARRTWHHEYQLFRLYLGVLDFEPIYYDVDSNEISARSMISIIVSDKYKPKFDALANEAIYKLVNGAE